MTSSSTYGPSTHSEHTFERRAVQARRMAHTGDVARAVEQFAELLPGAAERLEPERLLRFLGLYWDALRRRREAVEIERLLCLVEAQRIAWQRLVGSGPRGRLALRRHRRNLERCLVLLLAEAGRIGTESAAGQLCLRLAFMLLDALRAAPGHLPDASAERGDRRLALRVQAPESMPGLDSEGLFVVEQRDQRYHLLRIAA
ncbi:MAG: hypothetical protein AAGC60_09255 [Acidobacteriota bacterium]